MTQSKRHAILLGLGLALLAVTAAWSVQWMLRQRDQSHRAAAELADCMDLARSMDLLRGQPAIAKTEATGDQRLNERIDVACRQAGLGESSVQEIAPRSPQSVRDSPYLQRPTVVSLRGVSLEQLATFLVTLTDGAELRVRDLRLRTPHGEAPETDWDVEMTLTYLIYDPLATAGREL